MSSDNSLPATIEEALDWMLDQLDDDSVEDLRNMDHKDLILLQNSYGAGVRGSLGLGGDNEPLIADIQSHSSHLHPDDMGMFLVECLWVMLQDD